MLDTYRKLETPENIDLDIHIAGPLVRILAFTIDSLIRMGVQIGLLIALAFLGKVGMALWLILTFVLEWFYPVLFEVLNQGQTPGKKAMAIAVVNDDSTPIGWSASIVRNFLRIVDFLPMGYVTGLVSMILNKDFKRVGDLAAGTVVIYREKSKAAPKWPASTSSPPPIALNLKQQRAMLSFVERQNSLTKERQQELANHLQPVFQQQNQEAVNHIVRVATWLRGGQ
ncbi:RDD family protein [Ketobacter sp.]|uniref:RDD family protein n=1 Tax=Ketobacter sp. TaxID=2083498 RepID=UPI000F11E00C|nr:RDD family protein [Ketobacter sp.]RLU01522.1 MAG: RDD family protein [Ketobacter sp.]